MMHPRDTLGMHVVCDGMQTLHCCAHQLFSSVLLSPRQQGGTLSKLKSMLPAKFNEVMWTMRSGRGTNTRVMPKSRAMPLMQPPCAHTTACWHEGSAHSRLWMCEYQRYCSQRLAWWSTCAPSGHTRYGTCTAAAAVPDLPSLPVQLSGCFHDLHGTQYDGTQTSGSTCACCRSVSRFVAIKACDRDVPVPSMAMCNAARMVQHAHPVSCCRCYSATTVELHSVTAYRNTSKQQPAFDPRYKRQ